MHFLFYFPCLFSLIFFCFVLFCFVFLSKPAVLEKSFIPIRPNFPTNLGQLVTTPAASGRLSRSLNFLETNELSAFSPRKHIFICLPLNIPILGQYSGKYWPGILAQGRGSTQTECGEVRAKTTAGQYSLVRVAQVRLVRSLLCDIQPKLVYLNCRLSR